MIQLSLEQGCTLRAIARSVQRAPSSISRELKRNGWSNPTLAPRKCGHPLIASGYLAPLAQQRADEQTGTTRCPSRLATDGPLWGHIERLLVSHETIYTALYTMPRGTLRTALIACLRQASNSRRPRARGENRRGTILNITNIHLRPPEIDERVIPGHWEGDQIKGARNASYIGTLIERTTLFVTLAKMRDATADTSVTAFIAQSSIALSRSRAFP